jgi:hypothetical protein
VTFPGRLFGRAFALPLVVLVSAGSAGSGCSSPEKLGGEGAECNTFTECAGGMICVPDGTQMICSSDASAYATTEEAGALREAAAPVAVDGSTPPAAEAASPGPEASVAPVDDSATPASDSAAPPAQDAAEEP